MGTDVVHQTYRKEKQLVRNNWRQKLWRIEGHLPNLPNYFTTKVFYYMVLSSNRIHVGDIVKVRVIPYRTKVWQI